MATPSKKPMTAAEKKKADLLAKAKLAKDKAAAKKAKSTKK